MEDTYLEKFGYGKWVGEKNIAPNNGGFSLARVIEVNKNSYIVSDCIHEMTAELSGKFLFDAEAAGDFPTVGDWVSIQPLDDFTLAIVHAVLPRKTLLKRKEPGKRIDFQLIAANIDFGLVMQSAQHVNFNLLDRYFVMLHESVIQPIAVINKIDLVSNAELDALKDTLSKLKIQHLLISAIAENVVNYLSSMLMPGMTYCLLGQSGVGKTSLLNSLIGAQTFKVNDVRQKDGKGKHTTVKRQLVCLGSGALFIDTPGMRELGNFEIDDGLDLTFEEFTPYVSRCRFRDCTHTHEAGCAIMEAVKIGDIAESRYSNYLKLKKESEFYEMSYRERRTKDKSFGKMIKNFNKYNRKYD